MADHGQTAVKKRRSLPVSFHYTLMMIPGFVWLILFSIVPMVGIVMAFQNFNPGKGIFGSEWVGLDKFIYLTRMGDVPRNIRNTLVIATVVLLATLAMGNVLNAGFDQVFNMYSAVTYSTGDIIDTYVYRIGITNMQYSLATAVGLFKSVVSFTLITVSYVLAYKFADYTIF